MSNYNEKNERIMLEMVKEKEQADARLLTLEIVMGVVSVTLCLALISISNFIPMSDWLRLVIIGISMVFLFIIAFCLLKIEQVAGYYECKHCHHKYVPTFNSVLWAMHMGRTRYMKCPKCNKNSWQKKVISKD